MIKTILVCLAVGLGLLAPARVSVAGPLNPPPGPVAPTGKTLAELEPRTAVNTVNTPGGPDCGYRITAPGSYYLTESLSHTGAEPAWSVVKIEASDVSLDLNGFTIDGGGDGSGSVVGVRIMPGHRRVRIHGGIVRNAAEGIHAREADGVVVEDVHIAGALTGIAPGSNSVVRDCLVTDGSTFTVGVDAQSMFHLRISGCTFIGQGRGVRATSGRNVLIEGCMFSDCGGGLELMTSVERVSVIGCWAQGCSVGFMDASWTPALNSFLKNVATGCVFGFSSVPHVATNPQTAGPWMNLEL